MDARSAAGLHAPDPYEAAEGAGRPDAARILLDGSPDVVRADTVDELAARAGLPPPRWPRPCGRGTRSWHSGADRDPLTTRPLAGLSPLAQAPLIAIRLLPLARKNLGGVRTDLCCRVLDTGGAVMPGLFAAGELAGLAGGHIAGSNPMEGIMFGASLFSGRVAGAWAAHASGAAVPAGLDARRVPA
jgi:hypothetical protein